MQYLKIWMNFLDIIEPLSDDEVGRLFRMMLRYADSGLVPESFQGNERFIWPAAKQIIDAAETKAEILRQNGLKGGRPKTKENQTEPNETRDNQTEPNETRDNQTEANESLKVKVNVNVKDKVNSSSKNIVPLKRFVPPTVQEIQAYCDERGVYYIDPQHFIDYYEARGWMLQKNRKMVDWKAAVRTWEKNERERIKASTADDLPY